MDAQIEDAVDRLNARPTPAIDREAVRAKLDATMFRIYGIARADLDYIMETFPVVKRKDIAAHGEYRTKRLILGAYDRVAKGGQQHGGATDS